MLRLNLVNHVIRSPKKYSAIARCPVDMRNLHRHVEPFLMIDSINHLKGKYTSAMQLEKYSIFIKHAIYRTF